MGVQDDVDCACDAVVALTLGMMVLNEELHGRTRLGGMMIISGSRLRARQADKKSKYKFEVRRPNGLQAPKTASGRTAKSTLALMRVGIYAALPWQCFIRICAYRIR